MSNTPRKRPILHRRGVSSGAKTKETKVSILVEGIHRLQGGDIIGLSGGNMMHLSGHHDVTVYGSKDIFSDELLGIMRGKIVEVKMLLLSDTRGANDLDASEIIGNAQSIVIIKDAEDFE